MTAERPHLLPYVWSVLRHPAKLARLKSPNVRRSVARLVRRSLSYLLLRPTARPWHESGSPGVRKRVFRDYDVYLRTQRSKLALLHLSEYDARFRAALSSRLRALDLRMPATSVLCVAARTGAEVSAFQDLGAFAVGIDLNPGTNNPLVLPGDFHSLQFADSSVELLYCNSLDHALDLEVVLREFHRVLASNGRLLLEVMKGEAEGNEFGRWEVTSWDSTESLLAVVKSSGFRPLLQELEFEIPWPGRSFLLARGARSEDGT